MIERFKRNESGYEQWLLDNPNGYVFNHFGGSDAGYNKLHHVSCRFLYREHDWGARTTIEKICCSDLQGLVKEIETERGQSWSFCEGCW